MKLSEQTMAIIKSFSKINPNFYALPGNCINTINTSKSLICNALIEETIPVNLGIYDLGQFIATLENFEHPDLEFHDDHVVMSDSNGARVKYYYADPILLVYNKKTVRFPGCDVSFKLSPNDFKRIKKASATLGVKELFLDPNNDKLVVLDSTNSTKHQFSVDVEVIKTEGVERKGFYWSMDLINKLMMIDDDYLFEISDHLISRVTDPKRVLEYYIALLAHNK